MVVEFLFFNVRGDASRRVLKKASYNGDRL